MGVQHQAMEEDGASNCERCKEPFNWGFIPSVEAYETFDQLLCDECVEAAQAEAEEADDRRRANPLEPDFRMQGGLGR